MKQVKAFIHPHRISSITEALRNSGLCDLNNGKGCYNVTVSTVQRLYTVAEPSQQRYSVDLAEPVVAEAKLELICEDDLAPQLVELIKKAGQPSKGWIFTTSIETATQML
ncbi:P-II family nitrogen regulator [Undibacterium sp. Jales W-56]|uniref:P-II family nitrogen regulator n=1 Tax=Undibacterium sp. Jales W-56 TaxID=2897325 RepID=UPI0021D1E6F3|nr:P-II family nitrogen regulator [Undibacterium sp. Jales W-56]MCU6435288.1 P-II family nitrogen regulator [Undibacterium sp. Jales W-56]